MTLEPLEKSHGKPVPLLPWHVERLFRNGSISPAERLEGLACAGWNPRWARWFDRLLLVAGAGLVLAGIIFFFAYNWADMHKFLKLGLVQAGLCLGVLAALYFGLDSKAGRASLVGAGVLVGVFFAVFGQIYQTGADAWELFRSWALLLLPWALFGRSAGFWLLVMLVGNAWGLLWWGQGGDLVLPVNDDLFMAGLAVINLAMVAVFEFAGSRLSDYPAWRGWRFAFLLMPLGLVVMSAVDWAVHGGMSFGLLAAFVALAIAVWLGVYRRDAGALALCLLSVWAVAVIMTLRFFDAHHISIEATFTLTGIVSILVPVVGIRFIMKLTAREEAA